jgi:NADH:ubiquinone oxidoreductase subunit H
MLGNLFPFYELSVVILIINLCCSFNISMNEKYLLLFKLRKGPDYVGFWGAFATIR